MRHAIPLHEFMPYGAPDLIESRRRHMVGSLLLASSIALVLYALSTGLTGLFPEREEAPARPLIPINPGAFVVRPPPLNPTPKAKIRAVQKPDAIPLPVPDAVAPPVSDVPPTPSSTPTTGEIGTGTAIAPTEGAGATPTEKLPALGEWVYVEQLPAEVREVKPEYPELAIKAEIEGLVIVQVLVGRDGHVMNAVLSKTNQIPMLNEAALEAARQWVFTPGSSNGKPVACWTAISFRFRLR